MFEWNEPFNLVMKIKYDYISKFGLDTYNFESWMEKLTNKEYNKVFESLQTNQFNEFLLIRYGLSEMQDGMWLDKNSIYRECISIINFHHLSRRRNMWKYLKSLLFDSERNNTYSDTSEERQVRQLEALVAQREENLTMISRIRHDEFTIGSIEHYSYGEGQIAVKEKFATLTMKLKLL
jgi:hypothetical protein